MQINVNKSLSTLEVRKLRNIECCLLLFSVSNMLYVKAGKNLKESYVGREAEIEFYGEFLLKMKNILRRNAQRTFLGRYSNIRNDSK